jgi:hypothetical protein
MDLLRGEVSGKGRHVMTAIENSDDYLVRCQVSAYIPEIWTTFAVFSINRMAVFASLAMKDGCSLEYRVGRVRRPLLAGDRLRSPLDPGVSWERRPFQAGLFTLTGWTYARRRCGFAGLCKLQ